ncbi:MAG: helix-turn-helix transcriptional regulator [Carnobacterium sp.]|uniref:helix-turn-helix transcriptional regulator n=1 Tax=Carnobacterium sp. TaxID=48221 RepID=UPI002FCCA8A3
MPLLNRIKLKEYREEKGISVIEMAKALGIDRTTYFKKEAGSRQFNDTELGIVFTKLGIKRKDWGSFYL